MKTFTVDGSPHHYDRRFRLFDSLTGYAGHHDVPPSTEADAWSSKGGLS